MIKADAVREYQFIRREERAEAATVTRETSALKGVTHVPAVRRPSS